MGLKEVLEEAQLEDDVLVLRSKCQVSVSVRIGDDKHNFWKTVLRIYPEYRYADFVDLEPGWEHLDEALREKYWDFPVIEALREALDGEEYEYSWGDCTDCYLQ